MAFNTDEATAPPIIPRALIAKTLVRFGCFLSMATLLRADIALFRPIIPMTMAAIQDRSGSFEFRAASNGWTTQRLSAYLATDHNASQSTIRIDKSVLPSPNAVSKLE